MEQIYLLKIFDEMLENVSLAKIYTMEAKNKTKKIALWTIICYTVFIK